MSESELEIRKWLAQWPGNEHHLPELLLMRRGILARFVDGFLTENARADSYIELARANLELEAQSQETPDSNDKDNDDEDSSDEESDFDGQAELELELRKLEEIEKNLLASVSEKLHSHQLEDFAETKLDALKTSFLEKTKQSHSLEMCLSAAGSFRKRMDSLPSSMPNQGPSQKEYSEMMNSNKNTFKQSIFEAVDQDTSLVNTSFLTRRDQLCSNLRTCMQLDAEKFRQWWLQDLARDIVTVNSTPTEASAADDTASYVSNMNQLFSSQIKRWTDVHVRIGLENLELLEGKVKTKELEELAALSNDYNAILDLVYLETYTAYFQAFRTLDIQDFLTKINIFPEKASMDESNMDDDPEAQREALVEFVCVLLRGWPALRFKFDTVHDQVCDIWQKLLATAGKPTVVGGLGLTRKSVIAKPNNR